MPISSGIVGVSMADYCAIIGVGGPCPRFFALWGRTEPDLDLIKQVEQVTISALKSPAWRFAAIPSEGITAAVEASYF